MDDYAGKEPGDTSGGSRSRKTVYVSAAVIAAITLAVFLPSLGNDLVWDDLGYVSYNPNIRSIDIGFFKWAFTSESSSNWQPLTFISFALDYALWGLEPWGYHLTGSVFHAVNTFLVFVLAFLLISVGRGGGTEPTGEPVGTDKSGLIGAGVTALLFGLHPLHVESVAWVSGRKDVLYAFFFLLSVIAYLGYARSGGLKRSVRYWACLAFFIMALMSKPMAVTLPVVLLILDYYPLGRSGGGLRGAKRLLIEKTPFIVLSALSSVITIWAQWSGGALGTLEIYPLTARALVALRAYAFYIYKMLLPLDLSPYYPYPEEIRFLSPDCILSVLLLAALTALCIRTVKRNGLYTAVWVYYLVTLLPVVGIVQVGSQAAADRYTYLPCLGLFLLLGLKAEAAFTGSSKGPLRALIAVVVLLVSITLAALSVKQISIWKDSVVLWSYTVRKSPDGALPHYNLGVEYVKLGRIEEAIKEHEEAVRLNPDYAVARYNLGMIYYQRGKPEDALRELELVARIEPGFVRANYNLGVIYDELGLLDEALKWYEKTVELAPANGSAYNNMGIIYGRTGRYEKAVLMFEKALEVNPDDKEAMDNFSTARQRLRGE